MRNPIEGLWRPRELGVPPPSGGLEDLLRKYPELSRIPQDKFPSHVLIIPDGNGRWARSHDSTNLEGHKKGKEVAIQILRDLRLLNQIKIVTLWGMSADNLDKRDPEEKENLFKIFEETLIELTPELMEENGQFAHLGRKDRIPKRLLQIFNDTEALTAENTGQTVCLAVDYGGQDQEIRMFESYGEEVRKLPLDVPITDVQQRIIRHRDGGGKITPADLVIRTSGELRTSGLGWLGEKAEFVSITGLFPTIGTGQIVEALAKYSRRERRDGGRPKTT